MYRMIPQIPALDLSGLLSIPKDWSPFSTPKQLNSQLSEEDIEWPGTPTPCPPNRRSLAGITETTPVSTGHSLLGDNNEELDENGLLPYSSPITGRTKSEKHAKRQEKRARKRARKQAEKEVEATRRLEEEEKRKSDQTQAEEAKKKQKIEHCQDVLSYMKARSLTIGDILLFVSTPSNWRGKDRHDGLFRTPGRIQELLTLWTSSTSSEVARSAIHGWALDYVGQKVSTEADVVTRDGILRTEDMKIDHTFALDFNLDKLYQTLFEYCPSTMQILKSFSTTRRQERKQTEQSIGKKERVSRTPTIVSALLNNP